MFCRDRAYWRRQAERAMIADNARFALRTIKVLIPEIIAGIGFVVLAFYMLPIFCAIVR